MGILNFARMATLADGDILGFYTSSQGGELVCISKLDGSKYYSISQGGIRKSNMMLAAEFKENGVLNFRPYAITGEFKAGQITWSNGTVYAKTSEEEGKAREKLAAEATRKADAEAKLAQITELFGQIDRDGDGLIDRDEFHKAMTGKRKPQLRALLKARAAQVHREVVVDHRNSDGWTYGAQETIPGEDWK